MRKRDAKALGRWCQKHDRQYERVVFPGGAQGTMCATCAADPGFAHAMDELARAVKALDPTRVATNRGEVD